MGVGIFNKPTTPNAAYTRLGYYITSSVATDTYDQYQYVMDVYESGSSDRIARVTQTANPIGVIGIGDSARFDPSRILQGELGWDYNWKITGSVAPVNTVKEFDIKFGEQYGTSPSSSITVYPNQAQDTIKVFPAVIDPNDLNARVYINGFPLDGEFDWNFQSQSYESGSAEHNQYLTDAPYAFNDGVVPDLGFHGLVNSDDYMTITIYADKAYDPARINFILQKIENGLATNVNFGAIYLTPPSGSFNTLGIGPQNIIEQYPEFSSSLANGDWNYVYSSNDSGGFSYFINDKWDGQLRADMTNAARDEGQTFKQCSDEYTRFAFINKYGFWDYYNVYNPVRTQTDLERQRYQLPQLNYTIDHSDFYGRGESATTRQTHLRSRDTYSIDTDYISKTTANWLEQLIESPEVFIQQGTNFIPIVITNSEYTHNNSSARNKLFQYTIEWVTANPRRARL